MQQYFLKLTIVCALLVAVSGCKKDDKTPMVSDGYVQFKVEGNERRFDDYDQNTSDIVLTVQPKTYAINFSASEGSIINKSLYFQQVSTRPLEVKKYVFNGPDPDNRVLFTLVDVDLNNYFYNKNRSSGTVEITRIDTAVGGRVEGKFSLYGLDYRDKNNNVLYVNRDLTDGVFSLPVK